MSFSASTNATDCLENISKVTYFLSNGMCEFAHMLLFSTV